MFFPYKMSWCTPQKESVKMLQCASLYKCAQFFAFKEPDMEEMMSSDIPVAEPLRLVCTVSWMNTLAEYLKLIQIDERKSEIMLEMNTFLMSLVFHTEVNWEKTEATPQKVSALLWFHRHLLPVLRIPAPTTIK